MNCFVRCEERTQDSFLPSRLEDYVTEDNPVRVIDVFVGELALIKLGFAGMNPQATGRPGYHPSTLLKIYLYGYLNRIQSSRRLERETQRNVKLMWLTGRLMPDFKTIANFCKDNGPALCGVCRQFVLLCRQLNLFSQAVVAVDGSKFKAVNNPGTAISPAPRCSGAWSRSKPASIATCPIEDGMTLHVYWTTACPGYSLKAKCTTGNLRRIKRWEHEGVLEAMQERLDAAPEKMAVRRQTVEHPFGTIKAWMGSTHFLTKALGRVSTEMSLHVLAHNLKRVMKVLGIVPLMAAMRA